MPLYLQLNEFGEMITEKVLCTLGNLNRHSRIEDPMRIPARLKKDSISKPKADKDKDQKVWRVQLILAPFGLREMIRTMQPTPSEPVNLTRV